MSKILDRKQLVLDAMDNKAVERVPAGFWFHFLADEIHSNAFEQPELTEQVLAGEIKYIEESQPDFVKIMTDGFFPYTSESFLAAKTSEDLKHLQPLPKDDKWFTYQVAYAKKLTDKYGDKIATFYNLFCPGTIIKFMQPNLEDGEPYLASLVREDKEAVKAAFDVISDDLAELARRMITEAHVTGVYFSLQNLLGEGITREIYEEVFAPGEKKILAAANSVSDYNILHICGYAGHRNDLSWYEDYEVKTINWAAVVEDVELEDGKKLFGGRAVLGGFGNSTEDVLYKGTKAEIKAETKRLLDKAGTTGVILGADCTVPRDTPREHFQWVREALEEYKA